MQTEFWAWPFRLPESGRPSKIRLAWTRSRSATRSAGKSGFDIRTRLRRLRIDRRRRSWWRHCRTLRSGSSQLVKNSSTVVCRASNRQHCLPTVYLRPTEQSADRHFSSLIFLEREFRSALGDFGLRRSATFPGPNWVSLVVRLRWRSGIWWSEARRKCWRAHNRCCLPGLDECWSGKVEKRKILLGICPKDKLSQMNTVWWSERWIFWLEVLENFLAIRSKNILTLLSEDN